MHSLERGQGVCITLHEEVFYIEVLHTSLVEIYVAQRGERGRGGPGGGGRGGGKSLQVYKYYVWFSN